MKPPISPAQVCSGRDDSVRFVFNEVTAGQHELTQVGWITMKYKVWFSMKQQFFVFGSQLYYMLCVGSEPASRREARGRIVIVRIDTEPPAYTVKL